MTDRDTISVGRHRPVYLWAGPGTIRMNRLKFMDAPVDEAVHLEAHTAAGAQRMVTEAGFNWIYLTYDWGFPPEVEHEDWEAFRQAAAVYHVARARPGRTGTVSNSGDAGSNGTSSRLLVHKAIPDPAHSDDKAVAAQLLPDVADMDIYHPVLTIIVIAPHLLQKLLAAEHHATMLSQDLEQVKLNGGQLDRFTVDPHLATAGVDA
jgi:hypothetical protein